VGGDPLTRLGLAVRYVFQTLTRKLQGAPILRKKRLLVLLVIYRLGVSGKMRQWQGEGLAVGVVGGGEVCTL